jgi:hypothetical protein
MVLNSNMMSIHLIAYILFVVSFLLFITANITGTVATSTFMTIVVALTSLASQVLLCYIFLSICQPKQGSTNSKQKRAMPADSSDDEDEEEVDQNYNQNNGGQLVYQPLFRFVPSYYSESDNLILECVVNKMSF